MHITARKPGWLSKLSCNEAAVFTWCALLRDSTQKYHGLTTRIATRSFLLLLNFVDNVLFTLNTPFRSYGNSISRKHSEPEAKTALLRVCVFVCVYIWICVCTPDGNQSQYKNVLEGATPTKGRLHGPLSMDFLPQNTPIPSVSLWSENCYSNISSNTP